MSREVRGSVTIQLNKENRALQLKIFVLSKLPDNVDAKILDLAEENSNLKTCTE